MIGLPAKCACACVWYYPNFKMEKILGMKRKAPDQCDQTRLQFCLQIKKEEEMNIQISVNMDLDLLLPVLP